MSPQKSAYGRALRFERAQAARVIASEDCRHCGRSSQFGHPAGVVPGQWLCSNCGKGQRAEGGQE